LSKSCKKYEQRLKPDYMPKIIGDNKVLTTVSKNPFWTVLNAESVTSGERVWFKILTNKYARDKIAVDLFHKSAVLSQALKHANILPVLDYGREKDIHYIVMHAFEGKSLAEILKHGPIADPDRIVRIVMQICTTLQFAHIHGVAHGILNPESIFIDTDDNIAILHFGSREFVNYLLQKHDDRNLLRYAHYFPPERLRGNIEFDSRGEIYSVGALLYQMVTGNLPFNGQTIEELLQSKEEMLSMPPRVGGDNLQRFHKIIKKSLDKDPEKRYANFNNLILDMTPQKIVVETDDLEDEFDTGGYFQDVLLRIKEILGLSSPTFVGSKRRIVYTVITIFSIIFIGVAVVLLSEYGSQSNKQFTVNPDVTSMPSEMQESDSLESFASVDSSLVDTSPVEDMTLLASDSVISASKMAVIDTSPETKMDQSEKTAKETVMPAQETVVEKPMPEAEVPATIGFSTLVVYSFVDSEVAQADIFLDGESVGRTSPFKPLYVHGLVAGRDYDVKIQKDGFEEWREQVHLGAGDSTVIKAYLKPRADALRRFTFAKVDFADRIIIDNKLPSKPLPFSVDLPLGTHTLHYIDSQSVFSWKTNIVLDMNSSNFIYFDADQIGYGQLSVVLENPVQYGYAFVMIDGKDSLKKTTPIRFRLPVGRHKLQVFRDGFKSIPSDTVIFVPKDGEEMIRVRLHPGS